MGGLRCIQHSRYCDGLLTVLKKAAKGQIEVDQTTLLASVVEVVKAVLMRSLGLAELLEVSRLLASYVSCCRRASELGSIRAGS